MNALMKVMEGMRQKKLTAEMLIPAFKMQQQQPLKMPQMPQYLYKMALVISL